MNYDEIIAGLNAAFLAYPDMTAKHTLDNYKNFSGEIEPTDTYLACNLVATDTESPTMDFGGFEITRGILQIRVCVPRDSGAFTAAQMSQSIKNYFEALQTITRGDSYIIINRISGGVGGYDDGVHWSVPLSIYFTCCG